jgi:hypothetical protein
MLSALRESALKEAVCQDALSLMPLKAGDSMKWYTRKDGQHCDYRMVDRRHSKSVCRAIISCGFFFNGEL